MAILSNHGTEVLRVKRAYHERSYRSDGHILINRGNGWKLYKRLKEGVKIEDYLAKYRKLEEERRKMSPCYFEFHDAMVEAYRSLEDRVFVATHISVMPTDPDGVWSTCDDYNRCKDDIAHFVRLCQLFRAAASEQSQKIKDQQPTVVEA